MKSDAKLDSVECQYGAPATIKGRAGTVMELTLCTPCGLGRVNEFNNNPQQTHIRDKPVCMCTHEHMHTIAGAGGNLKHM